MSIERVRFVWLTKKLIADSDDDITDWLLDKFLLERAGKNSFTDTLIFRLWKIYGNEGKEKENRASKPGDSNFDHVGPTALADICVLLVFPNGRRARN